MKRLTFLLLLLLSGYSLANPALNSGEKPTNAEGVREQNSFTDWFKNRDQKGKKALSQQQYEKAAELFQDPYRKGIAHYRAGDFAAAEQAFQAAEGGQSEERPEGNARYNLGNSLFQQQRYQEAIDAYDRALAKNHHDQDALANKQLAEQMLQQQENDHEKQTGNKDQKQNPDLEANPQQSDEQQQDGGQGEQSADSPDQQDGQRGETGQPGQDEQQPDSGDRQAQNERQQPDSGQSGEEEEKGDQADRQAAGDKREQGSSSADPENPGAEPSQSSEAGDPQQDLETQQWLNRLEDNPKQLLRNQFYIREQQSNVRQGNKPW